MPLTFYYASGSPYAWRVWLALEYKAIAYTLKKLSFDAGDLTRPEYLAINPRHKVPAIVEDGFTLYESAAIVEYLDEAYPAEPRLIPGDARGRALVRRMVQEADQYFAPALERLAGQVFYTPQADWSQEAIAGARADIIEETAKWDAALVGDFLAGPLSAADFALFPQIELVMRMQTRKPDLLLAPMIGRRMREWLQRMEALAIVERTWPPHWK